MSSRPAAARPVTSGERGFTLVEVLVGAMLLGIFISFIYGVVVSAFQVRRVIQTSTSALAQGTLAVELVARDLQGAMWRPMKDFDAFKAEEDGTDRSRIDFVTSTNSRREEEIDTRVLRSDISEVGYRTRETDNGLGLYRREQFAVDSKPLEGGDYYRIVSGVTEFRLEWYEEDPSKGGGDEEEQALDAWDAKEKKKLPRACRITLVLEGNSTDPARPDELTTFKFTRWVVLPGYGDIDPPDPNAGNNGGENNGGNNPGGG